MNGMSKEVKRYAERDAYELDKAGNYYCRHVSAMTGEGLHSKSDIAAELGWRDMQIDALLAENESLRGLYKMHQQTETREMRDLRAERDALLAERDALKALLVSSREFVAAYVNSSFFGPNARKQLEAIDAALQGEQL